jgi:hypothetical protein
LQYIYNLLNQENFPDKSILSELQISFIIPLLKNNKYTTL